MDDENNTYRVERFKSHELCYAELECYQARKVLECKTKIIKGLEELEPYNNVLKMDGMCEPYVIALKQMKLKRYKTLKLVNILVNVIYFRV